MSYDIVLSLPEPKFKAGDRVQALAFGKEPLDKFGTVHCLIFNSEIKITETQHKPPVLNLLSHALYYQIDWDFSHPPFSSIIGEKYIRKAT